MTVKELGLILKEMYDKAPYKETSTMVHLFGIKYSEIIQNDNISCKDIAKEAGIEESLKIEIRKGVKLAKYVKVKPE